MKKLLLILGLVLIMFSCKVNITKVSKSIVKVENMTLRGGIFPFLEGHGSGFFVDNKGTVVTNYHVINGADILYIIDSDGKKHRAIILSYDIGHDIAILSIKKETSNYLKLGNSRNIELGEDIYVIGYPLRLELSVQKGIISNKSTGTGLADIMLIQHDAVVNPGHSGSPLINSEGDVIGVNCGLYSETGRYIGHSFAIPINVVIHMLEQIK